MTQFDIPSVIIKFFVIAFAAAIAAWLPVAISMFVEVGMGWGDYSPMDYSAGVFSVALMGSYVVGFPVAVLIFLLSAKHLVHKPSTLVLITLLASVVMLVASFAIGDAGAMLAFGLPSVVAAITYAILGHLWIIRPVREGRDV